MSDQQKKSNQDKHVQDRAELGDVESATDLEPRVEGSKARVQKEQQRLVSPEDHGYFEEEAVALGKFGARSLHVSRGTLKDAGSSLAEYQAGYNMYTGPLRSMLRAMGRVKDLTEAGATVSPTGMQKSQQQRFRSLSQTSHGDALSQSAFHTWQQDQTKMSNDIKAYAAGQMQLQAAVENWHACQDKLEQRRITAQRAAKSKELDEIREVSQTLAEITRFSMEAWTMAGEVGEAFEAATVAVNEDVADAPVPNKDGTMPAGLTKDEHVGTAGNRAVNAIDRGRDHFQKARGPVGRAADIIRANAKGAELHLTLEDVFTVMTGKAGEKLRLEREINQLTAKLSEYKFDEEQSLIKAGATNLTAFRMEIAVRGEVVQSDRMLARTGAARFNQALSGGDEKAGLMSTYMASAAEELVAFAHVADAERRSMVDPYWKPLDAYWNDEHVRMTAAGYGDDMRAIQLNIVSVAQQQQFFRTHLPQWEANAQAWRAMLKAQTGNSLVAQGNDLDRK